MNFALLGIDDDVLALARAIVAGGHDIASFCEPGEYREALLELAPHATELSAWEGLLAEHAVAAVIIGRAALPDIRADQLRKFVQAKVPLIVVQPACEAIVGYEIEMIRRDVEGLVIPYYPGRMHPIWWPGYAVKPLGELSQAIFTRRMASTAKEDVLAQLARDVATLQPWLVEIKRVSAIGSLGDGRSGANLSVQMTSAGGALAQWILEPAGDSPGATLSLRGAQNRWDYDLPDSGPWRMQSEGKWHEATGDAEQAFVKFAAEILEQNIVDHLPGWLAACRATEVADTVPRCLARGKTIDLYNEEHTEEGAFKGVMAVGGCLILMLGLLAVVMVAMIEGLQLPLYRFSLWSNWPLYICAVFFFFLLLQLFRFAARGNATRSSASKDPSDVGV